MKTRAIRLPLGMRRNSEIVCRGRGISGLYRLPVNTTHRGEKINVQHYVYTRLVDAGKEFGADWRDLKWSVAKDLTVHVSPPDTVTINGVKYEVE